MSTKTHVKDFIRVLLSSRTEKEMVDLLEGILTPQELIDIPQRLAIIKMLKEGIPQHEIAQKLHVGIATVTRGSKELQKGKFKNV